MNTSKQVNVMIGLMFLTFAMLGGYFFNESNRADDAEVEITERNARRGARLFVNNCRSCHGLEGLGAEEGAIAPALNTSAFLILTELNRERLAEQNGIRGELALTLTGDASGLEAFLTDTITCGRTNTFMPTWSQQFGGPLSDTQVQQLVTLITGGYWELVVEEAKHADDETGATAADILVTDPAELSLTQENCGQYTGVTALSFRTRDPLVAVSDDGGAVETPTAGDGGETPTPDDGDVGVVQGLPVGEFFAASCAVCHGLNREGLIGPSLVPSQLTESDEFYFETIANGRSGTAMPSWSANGLTDEEIATLVEFITTTEP